MYKFILKYMVKKHGLGNRKNFRLKFETSYASINTLRTGDADLRFYVTTVQDG